MGKPRSRLINYRDSVHRMVKGFETNIHFGKQEMHFPNSAAFINGRSIITIEIVELQELLWKLASTGRWYNNQREVIDFGKVIGFYVNPKGNIKSDTTRGIVHYSKTGAHVVPEPPKGKRNDSPFPSGRD